MMVIFKTFNRMRASLFWFWMLFTCLCAAQTLRKSFKLNFKYTDVYSHQDFNDNLALVFTKGKRGEFKILNNKYEIVAGRNFNIPKYDNRSEFLDLVNERNGLKLYFINNRKKTISSVYLDKTMNSDPFLSTAMTMSSNEQFVSAFNHHERFHVVTHTSNSDMLHITYFENNGDVSKVDFKTGIQNLSKLLGKETYEFDFKFAQYGVENMSKTSPSPFLKASSEKKLYLYGKKMLMVLDEPGKSTLIEINLLTTSLKTKVYHFHLDRCTDENIVSGISNFYNGYLLRLTYCKDQLNFSIIETDSSVLRRNFNVHKEEPIQFKNTVISQIIDHDGYRDQENYVVENAGKFLKILDDLKLSIHSSKSSIDQLHVKIGGVKQSIGSVYTGSGNRGGFSAPIGMGLGMGLGMGGGFGMGPGMGMGMSPFGSPFATSQNYLRLNTCSFISLINLPEFEHLEGNPNQTLHEKVVKFAQSKGSFSEVLGFLEGSDSRMIYGYQSGKDDQYYILEFTR